MDTVSLVYKTMHTHTYRHLHYHFVFPFFRKSRKEEKVILARVSWDLRSGEFSVEAFLIKFMLINSPTTTTFQSLEVSLPIENAELEYSVQHRARISGKGRAESQESR